MTTINKKESIFVIRIHLKISHWPNNPYLIYQVNGQMDHYVKENLLNNVLSAIPSDLNRDEWVAALPRALDKCFKLSKGFKCITFGF